MAFRTIYRASKRLVGLLPPWLLRVRPFGVYEIQLAKPGPNGTSERLARDEPLDCWISWVSEADEIVALQGLCGIELVRSLDFMHRRVAVAWREKTPIGCVWIAAGTFEESELGLRVELRDDEAWLFAAVVSPPHRNCGVYRKLLEFVIDDYRTRRLDRLLLGVAFGNEPSTKAHARQGAVKLGSIVALRSLGIHLCLRTGRVNRKLASPLTWRRPIRLSVERSD